MGEQVVEQVGIIGRAVRTLRWCLIVLLVGLFIVRVGGCAEGLAYWPSRGEFVTPAGYEDVWIDTPDGVSLHGWFMPARGVEPGAVAPAILHVHGNAGNVSSHESFSRFLTDAGFHVLIFDYRCYGRSDDHGPLNRDRLVIDTQAALDTLLARSDVDPDRVGMYGVSLGGAFALRVAADDPRVRAVATASAFSSWRGVASDAAPVLGGLLFQSGVDGVDSVAELGSRPLLVMHGLKDGVVDSRHANLLMESAAKHGVDAELTIIPEGDHNSLIQHNHQAQHDLIAFYHTHLNSKKTIMETGQLFKSKSHTAESFWKWFSKRSKKLLTLEGEELLDPISLELTKYHDGLVVLVSHGSLLPREFIISADGIPENVDAVEKLADAAPKIPNWKIIRFRPRFSDAGNGIQYGDVKIDTDAVQFVAFNDGSKIGVEIYAHWRKPEDGTDTDGPTFIMLDHTIGEYDVICGIGFIELHPLEDAPENARPWSEFAETFDDVYHNVDD